MKRILITSINSRFDELLVEYFIRQQYNVRILADYVDPGSAWLKLPVEIYCCSPFDKEQLTYAAKGCDFVIATHCNAMPPPGKKTGIQSWAITHLLRVKAVIYLNEARNFSLGHTLKRKKCIKRTVSLLNHTVTGSQNGRNKNTVRSIFVDASNVISYFEKDTSEACFELLAERIHAIIMDGGQHEKWVVSFNQEVREKDLKDIFWSWIETVVNRFIQWVSFPHKFTSQ